AEDGIRDKLVTGVQTCALPIFLTDVAERRVPNVVAHRHRLDEVLVETEAARHGSADLRHLECVRQARAVVVADRSEEDLRLVLRSEERRVGKEGRDRGARLRWR